MKGFKCNVTQTMLLIDWETTSLPTNLVLRKVALRIDQQAVTGVCITEIFW